MNNPSKRQANTYNTFFHIGEIEEGTKWITRVRISRNWNVLDYMDTSEVTSLDVFMLDDNGDELHGVVTKKFIWKFDPLLPFLVTKRYFSQITMNTAFFSTGILRRNIYSALQSKSLITSSLFPNTKIWNGVWRTPTLLVTSTHYFMLFVTDVMGVQSDKSARNEESQWSALHNAQIHAPRPWVFVTLMLCIFKL